MYGIVKQSGGYIWAYSELGRGTTFKIYLPSVNEAVEPETSPGAGNFPVSGVETILVVEDDAMVRNLTDAPAASLPAAAPQYTRESSGEARAC